MKTGLDSAYPPTPAQIAAAKAGGYSAWLGYFAGPNILNGWADQDFINVYNGGLMTAAYCSGWADPLQMKARADHLTQTIPGFVGMLDDESGIRSLLHGASGLDETDLTYQDAQARRLLSSNRLLARSMMHGGGARPVLEKVNGVWTVSGWVQPWLNSSGFGQYGNEPVFAGVHASRYVFAAYLGIDPGLSWPNYYPRPSDGHPCAWQFQGTTSMFGRGVDLTHFDDNFWAFGPSPHNVTEDEMLYVGDFHKLPSPIVLAVYADGQNSMPDPSAAVPLVGVGALAKGASIQVDGYVFSTSPVQSTIPAGLDYCWWHATSGQWVMDAVLDTSKLSNAPKFTPTSWTAEHMAPWPRAAGGGVSMTDVQNAIIAALAKLPPSGLSKDQVDAEIVTALGKLPAGGPHHHNVLGIVNTGPVLPDPS